jgi:hypothetical protein
VGGRPHSPPQPRQDTPLDLLSGRAEPADARNSLLLHQGATAAPPSRPPHHRPAARPGRWAFLAQPDLVAPQPTAPTADPSDLERDLGTDRPPTTLPRGVNDVVTDGLVQEPFSYLTTTGRVSSRPHTIDIWFAQRSQLRQQHPHRTMRYTR